MKSENTESKGTRFGCGFVAGLVFVLSFATGTAAGSESYRGVIFALGIALVFGIAAMHFGDKFWNWAGKWLP